MCSGLLINGRLLIHLHLIVFAIQRIDMYISADHHIKILPILGSFFTLIYTISSERMINSVSRKESHVPKSTCEQHLNTNLSA